MGLDLPPRLIKLETFDSQAQRQPAEACYLGKIYRVGEERNAWQWARSRQTSNRLGFQLNYPDARKAAEVQRTQGSRWHLQEWPAIVVEGTDTAIVACDIRINEPFLAFENAAPADGSLCSFAMVFAPRRGAHPRIFVVARGIVPPARLPFQQKTSRSSGANYLLSWLPINANLELKYATALVASFNAFLQQAVQP